MNTSATVSHVRPLRKADIDQVAELHRKGFASTGPASPELLERYRAYFSEVFLENPWNDRGVAALVHEESDGMISGFIGGVDRPMLLNGERIRARIGTQFIVDPAKRGFAGLKLLRALFSGPQDLTVGDEGNSSSRGLWGAFGGFPALIYSMQWYYPLKPCESVRRMVMSFGHVPPLAPRVAAPVARAVDSIAAPIFAKLSRRDTGPLVEQDPTPEELAACITGANRKIRPDYDERSLTWVLGRAQRLRPATSLQKRLFKTEAGQAAGWYVFASRSRGAVAEVLQLYANPGFENHILERLFEHARAEGAAALAGRMEPVMAPAISDKRCPVRCGPDWVLVHSHRPELLNALLKGDSLFSKLEGEFCLRFQ